MTKESQFEAFHAPAIDEKPTRSPEVSSLPLAGRGLRLLNSIIDSLILTTILVGPFVVLAQVEDPDSAEPSLMMLVFPLIAFFSYFTLMEAWTGRTLGKYVTGTKVVRLDGSSIEWWQALLRTFLRIVPYEAVTFLFSPAGAHDRLSWTRVVRNEDDDSSVSADSSADGA